MISLHDGRSVAATSVASVGIFIDLSHRWDFCFAVHTKNLTPLIVLRAEQTSRKYTLQ